MASFFKKLFKGVKKAFKKIVKSDLFKVVLIAAAIYTGGAALGAWGGAAGAGGAAGGVAGAAGSAAGGAAGAGAATGAATGVAGAGSGAVAGATTGAATGATTGAVTGATTGAATGVGSGIGATGGGVAGTTALPEIVMTETAKKGILSSAMQGAKSVGTFIEANPKASAMMMNAASSAMSPDETEILEEQERIRRERYQNMVVPGSVGASASKQPLYYVDGRPVYDSQGIINKGMKS